MTTQASNPNQVNDTFGFGDYIGLAAYDGAAHSFWTGIEPTDTNHDAYLYTATTYTAPGGNSSASVLTIAGDPGGDSVAIRPSATNPGYTQILINGQSAFAGPSGTVNQIVFNATGTSNSLTIDASGVNPIPGFGAAGVIYNGSTSGTNPVNTLTVIAPSSATRRRTAPRSTRRRSPSTGA